MLKTLRAKRTALVAEMRAIITKAEGESRDLTAEEIAAYDAKNNELAGLKAQITRLEGLEVEEHALTQSAGSVSRGGAIPRAGGPEAKREFESLGHFLSTVRFSPNDQRLNFVPGAGAAEDGQLSAEMRMDNNPSGGFMVPKEFRSTILKVEPQDALVRPRASVIEAGASPDAGVTMPALDQTGNGPANMYGGMSFGWIGEGDTKPATDAKLREITLTPKEIAGTVTVTDKLLRNWQGSSTFLENLMRQGVAAAEDYAFLRGTGSNAQPLGVLNAGATKFIDRAVNNQIAYPDLVGMVAVLLMRGGSAVWSMSQSCLPQIAQLKDTLGNLIWAANARDGFAGNLLGYPVRWNNRGPALGTKGDVLLGDWSQYLIKDGSGPFVAASEHVLFTQNKTVIKIFWNVDGSPWLTAPVQEENGYAVSPFVGLDVVGA